MNKTFAVVGGDRRFAELAELLEADGYAVRTWRIGGQGVEKTLSGTEEVLDRALEADAVILPLPLCGPDGRLNCAGRDAPEPISLWERLARSGRTEQAVLAGMVSEEQLREAARYGVRIQDYFRRESLTVANAAATADAALTLAVEHTRETLAGKRCLVLGYGRIGKILCARLRGMGAVVSAAARREEDRAWVRVFGGTPLDTGRLSGCLDGFDAVFNTIPAPVLDRVLLSELPRGCLLMELASRPGFDPAEAAGLDVLPARSLPGRLVSRTAAAILRDTIYAMIEEGEHA